MESAQLVFKSRHGDKVVEMRDGLTLFAGRTIECDIYLPSPAVSRKHAVFLMRGGQCGIKDLDSSNGTYLNGERLTQPVRLKEGDAIQIGSYSILYEVERAPSYEEAARTVILPEEAFRNELPTRLAETPDTAPAPESSPAAGPAEAAPAAAAAAEGRILGPDESLPVGARSTTSRIRAAAEAVRENAASGGPSPSDTSIGQITQESLNLRRQIPNAPKSDTVILEEEIGDGSVDDAFVGGDEAGDEPAAREDSALALSQAAAEAGLVGEFAPEDAGDAAPAAGMLPGEAGGDFGETAADEDHSGAADGQSDAFAAAADADGDERAVEADDADEEEDASAHGDNPAAAELPASGPSAVALPPPREIDPNAFRPDDALRDAVEARLYMYSFLKDMQNERKELAAGLQTVPEAVGAELDRQEREMLKIPPPEKAEQMIEARINRRNALKEKIAEAKKNGTALPPRPSKAARQAEDIAINQWTIIAQSGKEAFPKAVAEGFRIAKAEPLAEILSAAEIDPSTVMGGGVSYLALEQIQEEAKYNRAFLKAKLAALPNPEDKKAAKGGGGLLGKFGKKGEQPAEEAETEAPGESYAELAEAEAHMADRIAWITQEMASLEPALIKEFWTVYQKTALHFLQQPEKINLALRAFLRYGVIGFMPWWMSDEVREHVMADCSKNIVEHLEVSRNNTNILYADEYLAAVLHNECTPALDENLEINAKNSPEWKADKAIRKLINTRSQITLLTELLESLKDRADAAKKEEAALEGRIKALLQGQKNYKQIKQELGQQMQAFKVEATKLTKLSEKIRDETLAQLKESAEEVEARFSSGELPRPSPQFLIEREVDAVRKIGRLLANLKERFLPLVMRDSFYPGTDAVNDRGSIAGEIAELERRDPRMFLETMVESKKKANRVDLRTSPVIVLVPSAGILAFSWNPRQKPEDGRLSIPTCFIRRRIRERQMMYLFADFRWDTSKANAGMDVMASETIVAAFMGVRWDWRKRSKEGREKGLVYTDQNDRTNWRRVYEAYMETAFDSGKKLFNRNYDFYERIIGKYFDLPDGVELLRK